MQFFFPHPHHPIWLTKSWSEISIKFLLFAPVSLSSILTSLHVPEKHSHSMMLPPQCFTVGMVLGKWWCWKIRPKSSILVSTNLIILLLSLVFKYFFNCWDIRCLLLRKSFCPFPSRSVSLVRWPYQRRVLLLSVFFRFGTMEAAVLLWNLNAAKKV